jgi:hypothetical protein
LVLQGLLLTPSGAGGVRRQRRNIRFANRH